MSLAYGIGARALVPGLDDEDLLDVFDAQVDLHAERVRAAERERLRQRLASRMG